jgi:hypothetical protein
MTEKQQKSILESLISLDYCVQTIEASGIFTGKEKSNLKNFKLNLANKLKAADEMFNVAYSSVNDVQNAYELMIKSIVDLGIEHSGEIAYVIEAFKKNRKSILGISNKVNR